MCCRLIFIFLCTCSILNAVVPSIIHRDPKVRIVGGNEATPHSAPYMVKLTSNQTTGERPHPYECGGVLISQKYVLTSRACVVRTGGTLLQFGKHDIGKHEEGEVLYFSSKYIMHQESGLALIELDPPINFNSHISNIPLPKVKDAEKSYAGQTGKALGWGVTSDHDTHTNLLMNVDVPLMSNDNCQQELNKFHITLEDFNLCTSGANIKSTCGGDRGGPLVVNGVAVAITEWGPQSCEAGGPSIYINIAKFRRWINRNTDINKLEENNH